MDITIRPYRPEDLDTTGLSDVSKETLVELLSVNPGQWTKELETQGEFFATPGFRFAV